MGEVRGITGGVGREAADHGAEETTVSGAMTFWCVGLQAKSSKTRLQPLIPSTKLCVLMDSTSRRSRRSLSDPVELASCVGRNSAKRLESWRLDTGETRASQAPGQ